MPWAWQPDGTSALMVWGETSRPTWMRWWRQCWQLTCDWLEESSKLPLNGNELTAGGGGGIKTWIFSSFSSIWGDKMVSTFNFTAGNWGNFLYSVRVTKKMVSGAAAAVCSGETKTISKLPSLLQMDLKCQFSVCAWRPQAALRSKLPRSPWVPNLRHASILLSLSDRCNFLPLTCNFLFCWGGLHIVFFFFLSASF